MDTSFNEPLVEIATLLCHIHEHYFSNKSGDVELLEGFIALFGDMQLLTNGLSIFELHKFRKHATDARITFNEETLSYEQFYSCLCRIATHLYGENSNPKDAFRSLLENNILPVASSWNALPFSPFFKSPLAPFLVRGLLQLETFLRLMYYFATKETNSKSITMDGIWSMVMKDELHLSLQTFFSAVQKLGWRRLELDTDTIRAYIISLIPGGGHPGKDIHSPWYFAEFVLVIARCAVMLDLRRARVDGMHSGLFAILQVTADSLLQSLLDRFINYVESGAAPVSPTARHRKRLGLRSSAVLWMARQSGMISGVSDFLAAYSVIKKYIQDRDVPVNDAHIPISSVVPLLCELAKIFASPENHNFSNLLANCSRFSDTSSSAVYLALTQPMILFAEPHCVPSIIAPLYSLPAISCIHSMEQSILRISEACESSEDIISIARLHELLMSKAIIPQLVRYDVALKMILYIIDVSPLNCTELAGSSGDMTDVDISELTCSRRELMEIAFALSQILFSIAQSDITPCLVLERHVDEVNQGEWVVNQLIASSASQVTHMPKISIRDEIDRFYCFLEICDPELNGEDFCKNMSSVLADMTAESKIVAVEQSSLHKTLHKFSQFVEHYTAPNWSEESKYNLRNRLPLPLMSTAIVHLVLQYPSDRIVYPWAFLTTVCEAYASHTRYEESDFACEIMEMLASSAGCPAGEVYDFVMSAMLLPKSNELDAEVCGKIICQASSHYFSAKVQSLLELSKDLLFHEYLRCFSMQSASQQGPFLENSIQAIPSFHYYQENSKRIAASRSSLTSYLKYRFPESFCEQLFDLTDALFSSKSPIYFASFIFIVVSCGSHKSVYTAEDEFVSLIRTSLAVISADHEKHMKLYGISFVNILISEPSKRAQLSAVEEEMLLKLSLQHFNNGVRVESTPPTYGLPPSPPVELWDVARFMQFCRVVSIFPTFDSMLHVWRSFGRVLFDHYSETRLSMWDDKVVGPLPVLVDYDKLSLLLSKLIVPKTVSKFVKHLTSLQFMLSTIIAPRLAGALYNEKILHLGDTLEDILRFGGDRLMSSLDVHYVWISETFDQLAELADSKEPQILTTCRFVSSIDILNLGQVSLQAKKSLSSRLHTSHTESSDVTICRTEFEELLLRCAFLLWEKAGGLSVEAQKGEVPPMLQRLTAGNNDEVVREYNKECEQMLQQLPAYKKYRKIHTISAAKSTLRSWGVDFLSPFLLILKLFGQFPRPTSFKKQLQPVALPEPLRPAQLASPTINQQVTIHSQKTYLHDGSPKLIGAVSPTSPDKRDAQESFSYDKSPSRLPLPTATPTKLLRQPDVKDRSNELLTSILAMRTKSSQVVMTPPRKRQEDTVVVHDLSPTVRISQKPSPQPSPPSKSSYTSELVESTKEALWPVFATYCSCSDSLEPGKLSGPNLFALLSKLDLLGDDVLLSDVILLFHRISAHSLSLSPVSMMSTSFSFDDTIPPLFTFEEFLVFLCAYAMLKFEGKVTYPVLQEDELLNRDSGNEFFSAWMKVMESSHAFAKLMIDFVLPLLRRHSVLASPEDARHRDMQGILFSLDIVFHVEKIEKDLRNSFICRKSERIKFKGESASGGTMQEYLVNSLQRIKIVPQIISIKFLFKLIRDILPAEGGRLMKEMTFPQYEWIVCVVAFSAVHASAANDLTKVNGSVVGEIIETMVSALLDITV